MSLHIIVLDCSCHLGSRTVHYNFTNMTWPSFNWGHEPSLVGKCVKYWTVLFMRNLSMFSVFIKQPTWNVVCECVLHCASLFSISTVVILGYDKWLLKLIPWLLVVKLFNNADGNVQIRNLKGEENTEPPWPVNWYSSQKDYKTRWRWKSCILHSANKLHINFVMAKSTCVCCKCNFQDV